MATNPYAAPLARVADAPAPVQDGEFLPQGRAVAAGRGWQWIVEAWLIFRHQPGLWMGAMLLILLAALLLNLIPVLGQLAVSLLTPVIGAGLLAGARAIDAGGSFELGQVLAGFRLHTGRLLGIGAFSLASIVVFFAAVMVIGGVGMGMSMMSGDTAGMMAGAAGMALGTLVGFALLIPFYMALWFAPALVIFNDYRSVDALKASFAVCLKNIVPFLVYGLAFFVVGVSVLFAIGLVSALLSLAGPLMMLAVIPFALAALVFVPVVVASVYTAYRDLFYAR